MEEQTLLSDVDDPSQIVLLLQGKCWKVIVERQLFNLVKQQEGDMNKTDWEKAKVKIDDF
jgi:hypothetical protein